MDREQLKERIRREKTEVTKSRVPIPEQTVHASVERAKNLLKHLKKASRMSLGLKFTASSIADNIHSSVKDLGIKAYVPEINITDDLEESVKSVSNYINSCIEAQAGIENTKKMAEKKLLALADAVERTEGADIEKIKRETNAIVARIKADIYDPRLIRSEIQKNLGSISSQSALKKSSRRS